MFNISLTDDAGEDSDILSRWKLPAEKSRLLSWNIYIHPLTKPIEAADQIWLSKALLSSQDQQTKRDPDNRIDVHMEDEGYL